MDIKSQHFMYCPLQQFGGISGHNFVHKWHLKFSKYMPESLAGIYIYTA